MRLRATRAAVVVGLICLIQTAEVSAEQILFNFDENFNLAAVETRDVKLDRSGRALRLVTGHATDWPGITLKAPGGRWNLSDFEYVALEVNNLGPNRATVCCRVDNPGADGRKNCITATVELEPAAHATLTVPLTKKLPQELRAKLFGMRGYPGGSARGQGIDARNVVQLLIFVAKPSADHVFEISNVRAGGSSPKTTPDDQGARFPMIDQFGQFMHKQWPGKTKSVKDMVRRKREEAAEIAGRPGPPDRDRYGGFAAGPQLKASGRFRAEKRGGKWWLVDPLGRLFWSHGADCVRPGNATTPITDRRHWFAALPEKGSPLAEFYGSGDWAPHGYYRGKHYETYNFSAANLWRKYGADWKRKYAESCHRRLRTWGMNTIGNWSDPDIYLLRMTPYAVAIHAASKPIEGSTGYWGKFPDVFDDDFKRSLQARLAKEKDKSAGDPCCIGYFVGNELSWGKETSLGLAALASPPGQAAKKVFVEQLQKKYETIDRLNAAWGAAYASWQVLLQGTARPDEKRARTDLAAFYTRTAEQYFRCCREAVKQIDPEGLYLGCRFAWANDRAVRAAAKYCDVLSFNRYKRSVAEFRLPAGIDRPVVIGEFHFGALDRGMFHTGLVAVANQQQRADAYERYVRSALENPLIVGTHWFQFGDQATTGRGDGENYQIGLLDVCDTPYGETIRACRAVGYNMYRHRLGKEP